LAHGIFENALGSDAPEVRECLDKLASVYQRQGRTVLADYYRKRAGLIGG
jgi:hypothetical protein